MKPIPATSPWMMRDKSVIDIPVVSPLSTNRAVPIETSMCVRRPASLPARCR